MNIPDMTIEMKPGMRSENATPAKAEYRPPAPDDTAPRKDVTAAQGKTVSGKQSGPTREELDAMIAEAEKLLETNDVKLKFNVLQDRDTVQVEIIDSDGKTIRKIPDDDLLKLTKSLKNFGKGFLDAMS